MDRAELTSQLGGAVMDMVDLLVNEIEEIEATHPGEVEDVQIGVSGVAIENKLTLNGQSMTGIMTQCTEESHWAQCGFFQAAFESIRDKGRMG